MIKLVFTFVLFMSIQFISAQTLITPGSSWKYLDDGSNQGTTWRNVSFDDSTWSTGNAQLGYGDGDEATVISFGSSSSNKHLCYYFRKTINVTNPTANNGLKISILRDDGAVVYINGNEVARSNMPQGTINYNTTAAHTVGGSDENTFFEYQVPSSVLVSGDNVIAVEVHQRSRTSSDLSFDFKLEFTDLNLFKKTPYVLYTGNNNEMMVIWQLMSNENCEFAYGIDTNYTSGTINTTEYNSDHQHKVILTGLTNGQKYYYRVTANNQTVKTGSFNAAPSGSASSVTFFAYGDTRSNPSDHNDVAERILSDINLNNLDQTFIINSGDLVYDGDQESVWDSEFFNQSFTNINALLANLPYLTAMGNHEGQGNLFEKYFPYPMFMNGRYYYSFDYGPVHVTVIDQETDYSQGSTQYNWIVNDLSSSNKPWKIAVFHKPGWSAGGHSNSSTVQNTLQPLFEQNQVSLAINGHNHYYSRAVVNDVHHITTGGGGAPLYSPDSSYPNIVTTDESNHYCKIVINNNTLHFYAIRKNGTEIENFEIQNNTTNIYNNTDKQWFVSTNFNKITINTKTGKGKIEIYDSLGRKIIEKKINNIRTTFKVKNGIYFIRYTNGNIFSVKKILLNQ